MNRKDLLVIFINKLIEEKLLTSFLQNIFDYENLHDYNYLFRMQKNRREVIIDIYDNVSDNRFNRYIFDFRKGSYIIYTNEIKNVYVTKINVLNTYDDSDKLIKLAYLFTLRKKEMLNYAKTFLNEEFLTILEGILK